MPCVLCAQLHHGTRTLLIAEPVQAPTPTAICHIAGADESGLRLVAPWQWETRSWSRAGEMQLWQILLPGDRRGLRQGLVWRTHPCSLALDPISMVRDVSWQTDFYPGHGNSRQKIKWHDEKKSRPFSKGLIFQQVLSCFVCGQLKSTRYFPFFSLQRAASFCLLPQNTLTSAASLPYKFMEELWHAMPSGHDCMQLLHAKTPDYDG